MRRYLATALVTGGLLLVGSGAASAQETSGPAPITIDADQVEQLCEQRVPALADRVDRLTERIGGGAEVVGSPEWLRAKAEKARQAGRIEMADRLTARADRRGDWSGKLADVDRKLAEFTEKHCGYLEGR